MEADTYQWGMRPRPHAELSFKVDQAIEGAARPRGSGLDGAAVGHVANALRRAMEDRRARVLAMGAHAIKLGLTPEIAQLLDAGVFTGLLVTGSVLIHDYELHVHGATSEDVSLGLEAGNYGGCAETATFMEHVALQGVLQGLGDTAAEHMAAMPKHDFARSLLAACHDNEIPVAVAVALGADTCHWHGGFDGATMGQASAISLRSVPAWVSNLHDGGVWINAGSAVVLPEVFLKAVMLVRNRTQGKEPRHFAAVVVDREELYRPKRNVLQRPGGTQHFLQMPLEVFWPMLAADMCSNKGGAT